ELELADKNNAGNTKNVEIFQRFASQDGAGKHRRCYFRFLKSPAKLLGESRLEKLVLEQNRLEGEPFAQSAWGTGEYEEIPCGLLFRSIGYHGVPMAGVPFDQRRGVFANEGGRIMENGHVVAGLYAAGWIKRGPTGIIGTNRADSVATVGSLLADLDALNTGESKAGAEGLYPLLTESQVRFIDFAQWRRVDEAEIARGQPKGKPREKFTRVQEMLAALG
ncbi:MAG: NADP oxidoreductase, partial [Gammaproteobacteria bacterium]